MSAIPIASSSADVTPVNTTCAGNSLAVSPLRSVLNLALRRTVSAQTTSAALVHDRGIDDSEASRRENRTLGRESNTTSIAAGEFAHTRIADEEGSVLPRPENANIEAGTRIRIVPQLESGRSLHFEPIERVLEPLIPIKIGRFTDKSTAGARIAFKSKVVSRAHAEVWSENDQVFLKDTSSSSGTFLNHIRLSSPNRESKAYQIKDGDIIQLGIDYQGGTEEIYRCVKLRLEMNRDWQSRANAFNTNALQTLRRLHSLRLPHKEKGERMSITDCCICLYGIAPCQALFTAPCSHTMHYKCIRPLLTAHFPGFLCPLCRTFADLEASVEIDAGWLPSSEEDILTPQMGTGQILSNEHVVSASEDSGPPMTTSELVQPEAEGESPAMAIERPNHSDAFLSDAPEPINSSLIEAQASALRSSTPVNTNVLSFVPQIT